MRQNRF